MTLLFQFIKENMQQMGLEVGKKKIINLNKLEVKIMILIFFLYVSHVL